MDRGRGGETGEVLELAALPMGALTLVNTGFIGRNMTCKKKTWQGSLLFAQNPVGV